MACVRAVSNSRSGANQSAAAAECIKNVVDSGSDESCLPANFQFIGKSMGCDGPEFLDA